ncbi:hypothetical protein WJX74_006700 [Apatococcus lobatus]|uniref:Enkurin domain-containing protein n=1 Tax=Apatococcus lobatus TaxID=904363 RepID=A0AAW1S6Z0_9CHLO
MAQLEDTQQLEREYDPDSLIGLLGRGSTAGSKLYRLYYGKPPGASVGNTYNKHNMDRLRSFKSASTTKSSADEKPLSRSTPPEVRVPRVGRPGKRAEPHPDSDKGRRPAAIILANLEREAEELSSMQPPAPSGPLLDDKEKARLASLMQYRGAPPDASAKIAVQYDPTKSPGQLREIRMLERLFSEVLHEIQLLKQDIAGRISCSDENLRDQSNVRKLQGDLKFKVQELGRIDALIQQTEVSSPC